MNIYIAGRREDHVLIDAFANSLTEDGFRVVSTWHASDTELRILREAVRTDNARDSYLAKLFGSGMQPDKVHSGITDADRLDAAAGSLPFEIDSAFRRFEKEIKRADVVVADLESAALEAGYAWARKKQLIGITNSKLLFAPYALGTIKIAANWDHAHLMLRSQRLSNMMPGTSKLNSAWKSVSRPRRA